MELNPEDQGEKGEVKDMMEKRALRDYREQQPWVGEEKQGQRLKRGRVWLVVWGILTKCPELRTKVSAAGPKADRARPWTLMGGGIFLAKAEFISVKQFVICSNSATSFCKRKRGEGNRLKIFKIF